MLILLRQRQSRISGAALAEFALALPFILLFLISIVDLTRYVAARAVLSRGAQEALEVAIRIRNFDLDVTSTSAPEWNKYLAAHNTISAAGLRVATSAFLRRSNGNGTSFANLIPATVTVGSSSLQGPTSDVLILRPGDRGTMGAESINYVPLPSGKNFTEAIRNEPMVVEMRAQIKLLTPMLGTVTVVGRAVGYRENPPTKLKLSGETLVVTCGDGFHQPTYGEECDGGVNCTADCKLLGVCGDGKQGPNEGCDPSIYANAPAPWFRYCYPPGHPKQCKHVSSNRNACQPSDDLGDPAPASSCCGDNVQQTTEICDSNAAPVCVNGVCSSCNPNYCTFDCTTSTACPAGETVQYVFNIGCKCVPDKSVIN